MKQPTIVELVDRMKLASKDERGGRLRDNSDDTIKGKNDIYPDNGGRFPGTLGARWGDETLPDYNGNAMRFGSGVVDAANDTRRGVLGRGFNHFNAARAEIKADLGKFFDHVRSGDFIAHTALLGKDKVASKHVIEEDSLTERVHSLIGR